MTSRERFMAAARRQRPDRTPFDFKGGFAPFQHDVLKRKTGFDDPREYFQTDGRSVGTGPTRHNADFSQYHKSLPPTAGVDEWGIGYLPTESDNPQHAHLSGFIYPMPHLRTVAELNDYPFPDVDAPYRYEHLADEVAAYHARGLFVMAELEMTIFEVAWYMRSMEQLMMDFVDNPEFATVLLDRIAEKRCAQSRLFAESGVDCLNLGDDIAGQRGMLMSAPMWRRWLKPRLARVIDAGKSANPNLLINYHTDGNPMAVIPDLIEIGVDVLNPIQPECIDPREVKDKFGDRLALFGCIGTQTVLPFGTPQDMRRTVRDLIDTVGKDGGLILSPTHMIEPEVPWENIVAFVDTARDYEGQAA